MKIVIFNILIIHGIYLFKLKMKDIMKNETKNKEKILYLSEKIEDYTEQVEKLFTKVNNNQEYSKNDDFFANY